jgi:MSHA pilin protein MshD
MNRRIRLSRQSSPADRPTRAQAGLSLIELIMFIVIVSVALVGILSVLNLTTMRSADPVVRKQTLAVAEAMMEEILSKNFSNPAGGFTPATPGNMTGGWTWTARSLANVGTDIPGLEAYRVSVAVAALTLSTVAGSRISVTVTGPGETVTLDGFRANY